jgi:hypothetical protein
VRRVIVLRVSKGVLVFTIALFYTVFYIGVIAAHLFDQVWGLAKNAKEGTFAPAQRLISTISRASRNLNILDEFQNSVGVGDGEVGPADILSSELT